MVDNVLVSLVQDAKRGNPAALAQLLHRFRPLIQACCRGLTKADGQDLEQELHIQLIRLVQRCEPSDSMLFDQFVEDLAMDKTTIPDLKTCEE